MFCWATRSCELAIQLFKAILKLLQLSCAVLPPRDAQDQGSAPLCRFLHEILFRTDYSASASNKTCSPAPNRQESLVISVARVDTLRCIPANSAVQFWKPPCAASRPPAALSAASRCSHFAFLSSPQFCSCRPRLGLPRRFAGRKRYDSAARQRWSWCSAPHHMVWVSVGGRFDPGFLLWLRS